MMTDLRIAGYMHLIMIAASDLIQIKPTQNKKRQNKKNQLEKEQRHEFAARLAHLCP
jgi:hypothetical protein